MAISTPAMLARAVLGTAQATVGTAVPTGETWVTTQILLCHSNAASPNQRVNIRFANTQAFFQLLVPIGDTIIIDVKYVLVAGDTIQASTTTASTLTMHVNGVRQA